MNALEFLENRQAFPQADLLRYAGQWVAFSEDGRSILAAAETLDRLETALAQNRIEPQSVHFEYIPGPHEDDLLFSPEMKHEVPLPK
jgi:hypothetical protein